VLAPAKRSMLWGSGGGAFLINVACPSQITVGDETYLGTAVPQEEIGGVPL
jgi:hypothetical protein